MPELPEVETVRRGLIDAMEGARFEAVTTNRGDLRFPFQTDFAARLRGQTLTRLARRAKVLMAELSSGDTLLMHLGMSGSFRVQQRDETRAPGRFHHPRNDDKAHDHVVFDMSSGARVVFNDPRRFGYMKVLDAAARQTEPFLAGLGPEPLDPVFDAAALARACANRKTSLKAALLDQRVVAGLGNIYVCEALHRAHLSPRRLAASLSTKQGQPTDRAARLIDAIRVVLTDAIAAGGSTLRDHRQASGELGYFQHSFQVYDRANQPCRMSGCGGTVRRYVQNGRATFACSTCQR